MSTYAAERALAEDSARRAGAAALAFWESGFEVEQKDGGRGPLTEADLAANALVLSAIRTAFPADAVLSEESPDDPTRLGASRCWIVDPIDGTREFTLRLPEFCVSIGLVVDGEPVVGVLYNPATDELVSAEVGVGLTLDGEPAGVSGSAELANARILVSRTEHARGGFADYGLPVHPMGSVAWKLAQVAIGRADATFTPRPRNEWDLCAGVAAVLAGGGRATDGSGAPFRFNRPVPVHTGVCGTNGAVHDAVLEMLA